MNHVIMPFVNTWDQTLAAAQDVLAQSIPVRLLLINQGSDDATRRQAELFTVANLDRVRLWNYDPPLPLSAVWNRALRYVWQAGGSHAWVVNNDVRLHPDTYRGLLEVLKREAAWFVTGIGVTEEQFAVSVDRVIDTYDVHAGHGDLLLSKGGPDFSCYLITQECHRYFQFDEGFRPAYHEDNDYHRRLQLAGLGDKIFGVNLPFHHLGSGTLNGNEALRQHWGPTFAACQQYYIEKWGGLPGTETFQYPFDLQVPRQDGRADSTYYGQGKGDYQGPLYAT